MKTFQEFCEEYKKLPVEKIEAQTKKHKAKFDELIKGKNPGDLMKAHKKAAQVGNMLGAVVKQLH
jgi:hypothetical protein